MGETSKIVKKNFYNINIYNHLNIYFIKYIYNEIEIDNDEDRFPRGRGMFGYYVTTRQQTKKSGLSYVWAFNLLCPQPGS